VPASTTQAQRGPCARLRCARLFHRDATQSAEVNVDAEVRLAGRVQRVHEAVVADAAERLGRRRVGAVVDEERGATVCGEPLRYGGRRFGAQQPSAAQQSRAEANKSSVQLQHRLAQSARARMDGHVSKGGLSRVVNQTH